MKKIRREMDRRNLYYRW